MVFPNIGILNFGFSKHWKYEFLAFPNIGILNFGFSKEWNNAYLLDMIFFSHILNRYGTYFTLTHQIWNLFLFYKICNLFHTYLSDMGFISHLHVGMVLDTT